jgi:hypothetical protein
MAFGELLLAYENNKILFFEKISNSGSSCLF